MLLFTGKGSKNGDTTNLGTHFAISIDVINQKITKI